MECTDWSEWVAIRQNPFKINDTPCKLFFNIAWNDVEEKLAITCQEQHRTARDTGKNGWAALLTTNDVIYIHQQLSLIHPKLLNYLPSSIQTQANISARTCGELERYFTAAVDLCGKSLVVDVLFVNSSGDEYTEDLNKLEKESFEKNIRNCYDELDRVCGMRKDVNNMLNMVAVYALEDTAVHDINVALSEYYNYLLQPLINLRELAYNKLMISRCGLESADVGPRVKEECRKAINRWSEEFNSAVDDVSELYVEFYKRSCSLVKGQLDRMMSDREVFGKATFEVMAVARLNRIDVSAREEKLTFLNVMKRNEEWKREKMEGELKMNKKSKEGKKLEDDLQKKIIHILELKIQIVREEEDLTLRRLEIANKILTDSEFHDAVETERELEDVDDEIPTENYEIRLLKEKLAQIRIRKAKLRNQKNAQVATRTKRIENQQAEILRKEKHHAIQIKREAIKMKEEMDREKIEREREKTIQRIKNYSKNNKSMIEYGDLSDSMLQSTSNLSSSVMSQPLESKKEEIENTTPIPPPPHLHLPPPPPPPPPPCLPPPPPPAPPLPMSFASAPKLKKVEEIKKKEENTPSKGVSLEDVLKARGSLRSSGSRVTRARNPDQDQNSTDEVANALRNAINKLRNVISESEESNSESEQEFD